MMPSSGLLDDALSQFNAAIAYAYPELMTAAKEIWGALLVLQIAYIFWQWLRTHDFEGAVFHLICGMVGAGFSFGILIYGPQWASQIVGTGQDIAIAAGGVSPTAITPSGVLDQGFRIVDMIWAHLGLGAWLIHTSDSIALWIAGFITGAAFFAAGLVYFFTLLKATFLAAWGCLPLGFSTLEWTWPISMRWLERVLAMAIRLAVLLLIIGAGQVLIGRWAAAVEAHLNSGRGYIWNEWGLVIALVSVLWFVIILNLPHELSSLVTATMFNHGEYYVSQAGSMALGAAASMVSAGASNVAVGAEEALAAVRSKIT